MRLRPLPLVVFVLVLAATATGALLLRAQAGAEADRRKAVIDVRALRGVESLTAGSLRSLRQLQVTGKEVGVEGLSRGFPAFSSSLTAEPITTSAVLEQAVPATDRKAFERRTGLRIRQFRDGVRQPLAPQGGQYLVVTRGGSDLIPASRLRGLDVLVDPDRRPVIAAAARSGELRATPAVSGLAQRSRTVIVYAPLDRGRGGQLPDFVVAGYSLDVLGRRLAASLPAGTQLEVTDGATVLTGTPLRGAGARGQISFAGRRWDFAVGVPRPTPSGAWASVMRIGALLSVLLGILAVWFDRRFGRVEMQRDDAQARFASAFSDAPIGMLVVDFDGRVLEANAAFGTLAGFPPASVAGQDCLTLVHPEDRASLRAAFEQLISGRAERLADERRLVDADGHVLWVRLDARAMGPGARRAGQLLVQVQDVGERRRYEAQLQHMADHDPLTGLHNRRAFEAQLEAHLVRSERYGRRGALLVLDLDEFKAINDTLGHAAGDRLIVRVAHALEQRLRDSDVIARLGGDEFAVLLPEADRETVQVVATGILNAVRDVRVQGGENDRPRGTTASIGIVLAEQLAQGAPDELLVCADLAMYDAKEAGRDRFEIHAEDPGGSTRTQARIAWAQRLRDALDEDRFALWAQPIVDLASGRVAQYEVLLRYVDDDGELVAPGAFLPVAERFGLIGEIDGWVVRHAIGELARRDPSVIFEVNLSGGSMGNPALLDLIEAELERTRVDPGRLIFEVTETIAVQNIPRAREFADRLSDIGCRFALDDFGAGFGSFYYLKHLPFDLVKIDGEFIRSATDGHVDQLVIEAVVRIASGMGKTTVAEYVGDDATVELLRELGVDLGQGFHLGRPTPLDELLPVIDAVVVR